MCGPDESNYQYLPIPYFFFVFFVFTDWQNYIALYIPFKPPSPRESGKQKGYQWTILKTRSAEHKEL